MGTERKCASRTARTARAARTQTRAQTQTQKPTGRKSKRTTERRRCRGPTNKRTAKEFD